MVCADAAVLAATRGTAHQQAAGAVIGHHDGYAAVNAQELISTVSLRSCPPGAGEDAEWQLAACQSGQLFVFVLSTPVPVGNCDSQHTRFLLAVP